MISNVKKKNVEEKKKRAVYFFQNNLKLKTSSKPTVYKTSD